MRTKFSVFLLASLVPAFPAASESLEFTLENGSEGMIVQFFVSPEGGGKSVDLLKKKGLYAGKSRALTINDGTDSCVYRIRAVFDTDTYYDIRDKVDFCEVGTYTIGN